ncbi:carbohydrate kinase family protein [Aquaspirillum sp. LM1]|jgi:adenosine kinase|uniref:carbohydrate kinase family protein n=1 Tax=Aquaspirillum sp. LM1 TaxID=1938604 RepID=UPI000983D08A|nr:carbohydrate kinase family protein [Aquaspirillum sp. LM1]AQR65996.1 carbohydrate kinase family protein [Aquaspirillum sp. LM1]
MSVLVCGSLAYDTLLHFEGAFSDHLLPDQLHKLSVCFKVPRLRREFGGCAGNIAYTLQALGTPLRILASVGEDFAPYQAHLDALGVDTGLVRTVPGQYTAQCFITSDQADNQITAFHPGAMDNPPAAHPADAGPLQLAILAPGGPATTCQLAAELSALGVPFMFDPGQELPLFEQDALLALIAQARWLALNDYESELLCQRTGLSVAELASQVAGLVITRGGQGSDLYADGQHWHVPVAQADAIVDPTGCGDAYRAGLLYGLAQGWCWLDCGRLASVLGAIKIASRGGQNHPLAPDAIRQRYVAAFGVACPL